MKNHNTEVQHDATSHIIQTGSQSTLKTNKDLFRGVPPHIVEKLSERLESAFLNPIPNVDHLHLNIQIQILHTPPPIQRIVFGTSLTMPLTPADEHQECRL